MRFLRLLVLLIPVLLVAPPVVAQSSPGRADPGLYFAMVHLGKLWDPNAFVQPPGTERRLVDTLFSNNVAVGFSVRDADTARAGWTFWMDFDNDRFMQPRLARVIAQGPCEGDGRKDLARLATWLEKVLDARIGARRTGSDGVLHWPWTARGEYELSARRARRASTGTWALALRLAVRRQ
jgi:hypothetical protein